MEHAVADPPRSLESGLSQTIPEPFRSKLAQQFAQVNWRALFYDPRLERVARFVQTHLHTSLLVAKVASVACMNDKSFSRYFHRQVWISFAKFVRLVRVHRAALMLTEQNWSISEVRRAIGIRHPRTFERNFRAVLGVPPTVFKAAFWRSH
jgi:transcriptional regulator GlxA family with amidase domain